MADTKVAVRRLPFPVGTKMIFAQAAVPPGWNLDASDDDRFLRVVSGSGGPTGGPDNSNLDYDNLTHTHTLGGHVHNQSSHDHTYSHTHTYIARTGGMSSSMTEENSDYRIADNSAWYNRSDGHHLEVNGSGGSSIDEGNHDHLLGVIDTSSAITEDSNTTNTAGPNGSSSTAINATSSLNHRHAVSSSFRPRYFDIVVGELVA
jgi:hypothetical protein